MEYHKTKDIMHVKYVLGHKSITSTMIYINTEQATFTNLNEEEYTCKIAKTPEEAIQLLEAGFTEASIFGETHLFRKRK